MVSAVFSLFVTASIACLSFTDGFVVSGSFRGWTSSFSPLLNAPVDVQAESLGDKTPLPSALIERARDLMENGLGYFSSIEDEDVLAPDFVFRGPVIGPLNKKDYMEVLAYFSVYKALEDIEPNCFGFSVDPDDPYRVWFQVRAKGTYTQELGGPLGELAGKITPADNRRYQGATETWSLVFNDNQQVRHMSAGYVVDRFEEESTTNGKGLTFGILETIGVPFPAGVGDNTLKAVQALPT